MNSQIPVEQKRSKQSSDSRKSVAIILVNWNSYHHTSNCLKSIGSADYPNKKIIVVDNASSDDSLEKLESEFNWAKFIQNDQNLGFTGGNNTGIEYALDGGYDYIMLLNNDTLVEPDFLTKLIQTFERDPHIGAVQPKILFNEDRSLIWSAGGKFFPFLTFARTIGFKRRDSSRFDGIRETDWITGCAFLVKSQVINEIGMLSDLFFYGCYDDLEWSLRMKNNGYKLMYHSGAKIYHDVASAAKSEPNTKHGVLKPFFHYLVNRNHLFVLRLHTRLAYIPSSYLFQVFKFSGKCLYFIARGRFRKLKASIHGFINGIIQPLVPERLDHKAYIQRYK